MNIWVQTVNVWQLTSDNWQLLLCNDSLIIYGVIMAELNWNFSCYIRRFHSVTKLYWYVSIFHDTVHEYYFDTSVLTRRLNWASGEMIDRWEIISPLSEVIIRSCSQLVWGTQLTIETAVVCWCLWWDTCCSFTVAKQIEAIFKGWTTWPLFQNSKRLGICWQLLRAVA